MSEAKFWQKLKQHKGLHWEVLSDKFGTGIPDRIFINQKRTVGLVELKWSDSSAIESSGRKTYLATQSMWLDRWQNASGHAFLMFGHPGNQIQLFESDFRKIFVHGRNSVPSKIMSTEETINYLANV